MVSITSDAFEVIFISLISRVCPTSKQLNMMCNKNSPLHSLNPNIPNHWQHHPVIKLIQLYLFLLCIKPGKKTAHHFSLATGLLYSNPQHPTNQETHKKSFTCFTGQSLTSSPKLQCSFWSMLPTSGAQNHEFTIQDCPQDQITSIQFNPISSV